MGWYFLSQGRQCKAAERGDASAQKNLGTMYYNGRGVEKRYPEAEIWLGKAALQGSAESIRTLGKMYSDKRWLRYMSSYIGYVDRFTDEIVMALYLKAALRGNAEAQRRLGFMYLDKYEKNDAAKWCQRAAEQGDAEARKVFCLMLAAGYGVEQDYEALKTQLITAFKSEADENPQNREILWKIFHDAV